MKFLKKFITWTLNEKVRAIAYLVILIGGIGALIALARYSIPFYDDFSYGKYAKDSMSEPWDLVGAIKGAAFGTKTMWYAWQGTHSSIFFMCLMPGIYGEHLYFLGPIFLILMLTFSVFTLTHVVARDVLRSDKWNTLSLQCLAAGMVVLYIYSATQAFYWYNSGIHYTAMHSLLMLLTACMVRLLTTIHTYEKIEMAIAAFFMAWIIGGSNFVTALQCGLVIASLAAIAVIKKNKQAFFFIPAVISYGVSFYYNVSAPGNNVREAHFVGVKQTVPQALIGSFKEAFKWGKEFSNWKTLLVVFLMVPVIWAIVKNTRYVFKWWIMLLLMAWSLCFFASSFTSSLYATGKIDLARVINVIKINYHLLLVVNVVYIMGVVYQLVKKLSKSENKNLLLKWRGGLAWPLIVVWVGAFFFFYTHEVDPIGNYSVFGAVYYLTTGQAEEFYSEYKERLAILENDSVKDVVFEPYSVQPWFLINKDLSENAGEEQNVFTASYYGKDSIRVNR